MDVKRMSKTFVSKLQQNLRPLSQISSGAQVKQAGSLNSSKQIPSNIRKLDIENAYKDIKQNAIIDKQSLSNVKLVTYLKAAQKCWDEYLSVGNKNGQLACNYEVRFKRISKKLQEELQKIIVQGSVQKIKQAGQLLKPVIQHLQKKSRKFKQHENEFKVISKKIEQQQAQTQQQQDQIKQQMVDLVQKFKKYVINIQQNLTNDTKVIKQIGQNQDKQLESLAGKNVSMEGIIKDQKLGFFQLVGMGVFAIVIWVIGLMFIIIL